MFLGIEEEKYNEYEVSKNNFKNAKIIYGKDIDNSDFRPTDNLIQLKYVQFNNGNIIISALPLFRNFAVSFVDLYKNNVFSDEAILYIKNHLDKETEKLGLKTDFYNNDSFTLLYRLTNINNLAIDKVQSNTIMCKSDTEYINISGNDLRHNQVNFATLIGNELVSLADYKISHLNSPKIECYDISIETHENYRRNGYAVSNTVALANYLLKNGCHITITIDRNNKISPKTAMAAGFTQVAKEYIYWATSNT